MTEPRELRMEEAVTNVLTEKLNIYPFSVICTFETIHCGLLSITFWLNADLNEFLDYLDYKCQCDKSGYIVLPESNTILLFGMALINLYTRL